MAFQIALSGLEAASTDLEVTGHNIANASTSGFKRSRAEFADIFSSTINDLSAAVPGRGVRVSRVAQQFSQGSMDFTSNSLDLGINGEGFFVMKGEDGSQTYTRSGAFGVDREGFVVDHTLSRLQVFPYIPGSSGDDGLFNTGTTSDLNLPIVSGEPSQTTGVTASLNLSSSETAPTLPFDSTTFPPDAATYNHSTATTIYDSLGNAHTMTFFYRKDALTDNTWDVFTYVDGSVVNDDASGTDHATVVFDTAGAPIPSTGSLDASNTMTISDFTLPGGSATITGLTVDYSNTTQYGSGFAVNEMTQDGFTSGRLSGVDVDSDGVVFARFTNGQSEPLGKIALARFNNNQGLRQVGDTSWVETFSSGEVQLGEAGTSSFGLFQSGALENSNVDIATELVNLITAQRNFQANAQVITTTDTVTQTIINLR